jgi:hypothetical protein
MVEVFRKSVSVLLVVAFAAVQIGCSAFAGSRQPFSVTASEQDAKIYINGDYAGVGNVKTTVPKDKSVSVMVKKDGYYPATRDIGTKMSFIGILDIIGGCIFLIPLIGLAFPGSHELDQSNVSVVMDKASK